MGRIGSNSKLVLRHLTLSFPLGGDWQRLFPHSTALLPPCGCCPKPNSDGQESRSVVALVEIELDDCILDKIETSRIKSLVSIAALPPPLFPLPVLGRNVVLKGVEISQYTCHRIGMAKPHLSRSQCR